MKKLILVSAAVIGITTVAQAGGLHVSIGIGFPVRVPVVVAPPPPPVIAVHAPVVYAPAPVVYYPPPVVYAAPRPYVPVVSYAPPVRVVAAPPVYYGYGQRHSHRGWQAATGWGHRSGWGHCR